MDGEETLGVVVLIILLILAIIYFIPTIIAFAKNKSNKLAIFLLNLFLGWSLFGWVIALLWALDSDKETTTAVIIHNHNSNQVSYIQPENLIQSQQLLPTIDKQIGTNDLVNNPFEKLKQLKELFDLGILTEEEFNNQKQQILNNDGK